MTDLIDRDAAREALEAGHSLFPQVRAILTALPAVCCEECVLLRTPRASWCAECYCGDCFERREP